jgi:hypothetical protein
MFVAQMDKLPPDVDAQWKALPSAASAASGVAPAPAAAPNSESSPASGGESPNP